MGFIPNMAIQSLNLDRFAKEFGVNIIVSNKQKLIMFVF